LPVKQFRHSQACLHSVTKMLEGQHRISERE
jgi:hypothetical protein